MQLLKSKFASKEPLYVVVQRVPGAEPFAGAPRPLDECRVVFAGVLKHAPEGFFAPHTGASLHVVPLADWAKARVAAALLES